MASDRKRSSPTDGDGADLINVNTERAGRGVWLVKVPRYLSEAWQASENEEVGRLVTKVGKDGTKEVTFNSVNPPATSSLPATSNSSGPTPSASGFPSKASSSIMGKSAGILDPHPIGKPQKQLKIPTEHRFIVREIKNQTLAVLCEDKAGLEHEADIRAGKLSIEGRVLTRAECQPPNSLAYMRMKVQQIERVSQPKNTVQQMDKAVVKFKPINQHAENLAKDKAKKEGIKMVRKEREEVMEMLFHAFEKHQYYRLVDLQKLTNQPMSFVKEILAEIANYNTTQPHKFMWDLKPEYRNYNMDIAKGIEEKTGK